MSVSDDVTARGLEVRPRQHIASIGGRGLDLTRREFEILARLAAHTGWVLSAEQLSAEENGSDYSPESVSVLVSRLRRKLAAAGVPDAVETVRGLGYRLRVTAHVHTHAEDVADAADVTEEDAEALLRDASWRLQEAIVDVDHEGTDDQRRAAADTLAHARDTIERSLEE